MLTAIKITAAMPLLVVALSLAQDVAAASSAPIAAAQPSSSVVMLTQTDNLHILIKKGFRIKDTGQPVVGEVTQPVFHGEQQVIAPGAIVRGHITELHSAGGKARAERLLNGDLTPPRYATVSFDELVLPDGQHVNLATNSVQGIDGLKMSLWQTKGEKESLTKQVKTQFHDAIAAPNKMQRLSEALVTSLPYHPNYIDQGTAFNASVTAPTLVTVSSTTAASTVPAGYDANKHHPQYLHLRLLTSLASNTSSQHQSLQAVVSEPYYDAQHRLLLPAGTHLDGQVRQVKAAAWLHKQGALRFDFSSAQQLQAAQRYDHLRVVGVEAQVDEYVAVDEEGGMKATAPKLMQITAPLGLIGPTRAVTDTSNVKTAINGQAKVEKVSACSGQALPRHPRPQRSGWGTTARLRKFITHLLQKARISIFP